MFLLQLIAICFRENILFAPGDAGSKYYRIPAITTAKNGTLVAITDKRWNNNGDLPGKITLECRLSDDNGATWGPAIRVSGENIDNGYGDASVVTDRRTGRIFTMFNGNNGYPQSNPKDEMKLYFSYSDDNGHTWADKTDITPFIYGVTCIEYCESYVPTRKDWYGMFLTSGSATQMRDGTIMVAAVIRNPHSSSQENRAVWTHDFGKTWNISANASIVGGNEAKVFQVNDGHIVMSIRQWTNLKFSHSYDGGVTWHDLTSMNDVWNPDCDADAKRYTSTIDGYEKNRIVITTPYDHGTRRNVSFLMSYDEGKTWPIKKSLTTGSSAYSAVTFDNDGGIHVMFEKTMTGQGYTQVVDSFSLEWATDGQDTFERPKNLNWCVCESDCSKCPTGSYQATKAVWDQYVYSYTFYPASMTYTTIEKVDDFSMDLAIQGLTNFIHKNLNAEKITITLKNQADLITNFDLENVNLVAPTDSIAGASINLANCGFSTTGSINIIVCDKNQISLDIPAKLKTDMRCTTIKSTGTHIEFNIPDNEKIIIKKSSDNVNVPFKLILGKKVNVVIKGSWTDAEKKNIEISDPNPGSGSSIQYDTSAGDENNQGAGDGNVASAATFPTVAIIIIIVGFVICIVMVLITVIIFKKEHSSDVPTSQISFGTFN